MDMAGVSHGRVQKVTITSNEPDRVLPIELDGETPGILPATFEVVPKAIRLRY
jgi:diacylglycerol kinase family enzyme